MFYSSSPFATTTHILPEDLPGRKEYRDPSSSIGFSRQNRPIEAYCLGNGKTKISLLGGCHADEPVGPSFLRKLVGYLKTLPSTHTLLVNYQWWILPHLNPDGEEINQLWWNGYTQSPSLALYLQKVHRELPGEDIEFGFPRTSTDSQTRPENKVAYDWWKSNADPFSLHISFHGMAFAAGPWYLLEHSWDQQNKLENLKRELTQEVYRKQYQLHDVERNGEKDFFRLGKGFCSRPDSILMREYFLAQRDIPTAALFRPSSMETILEHSPKAFTAVSEMPLFILPDVGRRIGPPDLAALQWKRRMAEWKKSLLEGNPSEQIDQEAQILGLKAMSIIHQQHFQRHLLESCLHLIAEHQQGKTAL